jgi:pyruvate formate lyase activating enzyme
MTGRFYEVQADGTLECCLCPHRCRIRPGGHGVCAVRFNRNGELALPYYGRLSSVASDPIEKKPLYHFHPGARILSVGFVGCSFRCPFCQNYRISRFTDAPTERMLPGELVAAAQRAGSLGIAYTYSEPLIHLEYVLDSARLARRAGLKNVLVSNGYINPEPAESLLKLVDAANIDLKAFGSGFYRQEIGGELEEVKRFIRQAAAKIHLEVTTLVIPGKNSGAGEIAAAAEFLASLNPAIPYHLSAYYPTYRYSLPPTPPALLKKLAAAAREHLRYVYLGNLGYDPEGSDTFCAGCGRELIRRRGYSTRVSGLSGGRCSGCGRPAEISGV